MSSISMSILTEEIQETHVVQAAEALGKVLYNTPEYQAFLVALQTLNDDAYVHRLSAQMREHSTALQWGQGDVAEHQAALAQLRQDIENQPSVRAYRQAEQAVIHLCREVDQLVSQTAGVAFAANAKLSSCSCGG